MAAVRVAEGAYAVIGKGDSIHQGWGANQGFVVTDDGVLVVDTGFTRPMAKGLLKEIRSVTREPVRLVVNTHDHSDHTFGNAVFRSEGAPLLAHSVCRQRLAEFGPDRVGRYREVDARLRAALEGVTIAVPELSYDADLSLNLGTTPISLIHPPEGAHTYGDTMVLLPKQRVLFAGDVLWARYNPNLEDSNIAGWLATLKRIREMRLETIVPGHGPTSEDEAVDELTEYLSAFDGQFSRLLERGVPRERIAAMLDLPHAQEWDLKMIIQMNVDALYDRFSGR